ncbi:DNA gyrase inhibitor YacG [Pseudomonas sp. URMO17WK12:I2]|uniref:DNA gyrase inhibitor YacG n=1 Tax=Pseudomonas sp. URMO17WK12:I2 TaxID=1261623 RepID=UPI000DADC0C3|nr:DNA gyrase inhibitor YacG [Pseudomonas sp. URMO17WK12:I2]PZW49771.1 hypothetical protein F469_00579 [Pseudomonas sp. URMO17WK12:I2]
MTTPTLVACPTCAAPVEWGPQSPIRPFCSERCKLIDLGAWAAEEHAIPGNPLEDDLFSDDLPPSRH